MAVKNVFDLSGKTAVVLGGTSGIGHALAIGLAEAGSDVIASSRSVEGTRATSIEIESLGRRTIACSSDITSRDSLQALHDRVLDTFGQVDILVNSAGITRQVPTLDCTEDQWNAIFDVNLTGTFRSCQIFGRSMLERGSGRILNIASLSTFVAFQNVAAYCASKAAVGAFTKSLATEWGARGVLVNAIAPGIFPTALNRALLDTPRGKELTLRTPLKRFGSPDELISTALYLVSPATTFTNGQIIAVDGGFLASGVNQ